MASSQPPIVTLNIDDSSKYNPGTVGGVGVLEIGREDG